MKNNLKKILSVLLAVIVVFGTVTCVANIGVTAEDTYITKTISYDCNIEGVSGSISGNKYLRYNYDNTWVIEEGTFGFIPLSYLADTGCYEVWNLENISEFTLYTMNSKDISDNDIAKWYNFSGSADGETWYSLSYVKDIEYKVIFGTSRGFASYKLKVSDIPEGTNYIKLSAPYENGTAWNHGFLKVELGYKELLKAPEITAEYKNYYGVYANVLTNDSKVKRDVKISASNMFDGSGAEYTILKDGSKIDAATLYDEATDSYVFDENGKYSFTAKNYAGESNIEFTVQKVAEDSVVTKTTVDDIYNTGKTIAIERTDTVDATSKVVMSISKSSGANILPIDKYYMFPYSHGKNEPASYAIWYSDIGFGSFWVDTFNNKGVGSKFFEERYSFYYSVDGSKWTKTEFTVGEGSNELTGKDMISYRLTIDKIPDGAKYIKYLSLITDATKNSGWSSGILRAGYTTYVLLPVINANFADVLGNFANPITNGCTVPSDAKIEYEDVGEEIDGVTTVKKDGNEIELPQDGILTEDGNYEIIAKNVKGTTTLSFVIDHSKASSKSETYVFSEGVESSEKEFAKLLGITPAGAPKDFTKGDGNVIVNDTAIVRDYDKAWWGLTEGGTKLTIGSDTKGYKKDGYFYFSNIGADGKKYTGISITYTVAIQSSYPRDAYLSVYSADKYNGTYRLIEPTTVTKEPYTGAPAAAVYHATYYLGGEGSVVKIKFNPQAPSAELWKGSFLSILNLTKLSMPLATATANGEKLVNNSITKEDVKLSFNNELYYFVEKDGKQIEVPANKVLTEDGFYTVTACNYAGTSTISFYIAKEIPVIQLTDSSGNYLSDAQTVVDDVNVVFYNADVSKTFRDGELFSTDKKLTVDLNGSYVFTAENDLGSYEISMVLKRPLPTIKAYNFRSAEIKNESTIETQATYNILTADSYSITLNGKAYKPKTEFKLTDEGTYVITAVNKAGTVTLEFTIKYNPPLDKVAHTGDTVEIIDYHKISRTGWIEKSVYKYDNFTLDNSSALRSDWTGFKGGVLHAESKDMEEAFVTYKSVGFKSFHLYVVMFPKKDVNVEEVYNLYASTNGSDFKKLDCTVEHDISYITTGYEKYRFVANNIPENTKYIKVVVKQENANAAWDRCITQVEYSYNKANVGKLDVDDVVFMLNDAFDGEAVSINIYNNNSVIPKRVFEAFCESDKTLKVNLMNSDGETEFVLSFNGLNITEPMDFATGVSLGESNGSKTLKALDSGVKAVVFKQQGEWTLGVNLGVFLERRNAGKSYSMYSYKNGAFSLIESVKVDLNGFASFDLFENSDYSISTMNDLINTEEEEITEDTEQVEEEKNKGHYVMVVSRKKFVPNVVQTNYTMWIIIACVAVFVIGAATAVVIILIKKKKPTVSKG